MNDDTRIDTIITHKGVQYVGTIITIERTELGREDHGIWHTMLYVDGGGWGTGVGGYVLDSIPIDREPGSRRPATAFGMQWIIETVTTVCGEYGKWEDMVGKRIFLLHELGTSRFDTDGRNCKGIASLDGKRVMIFSDVVAAFKEENEKVTS